MEYVAAVSKYLGLTKPIDINIRMRAKQFEEYTAGYYAVYTREKLKKHEIRVYLSNITDNPNERDFKTIICHELIHAWQEENGFTDIHGESFQRMARKMQKHFPDIPGKLYEKAVDTP